MRSIWFIAGLTCIILGAIGAFLPLLPTVPFILLAAFCFARSSPSAHSWLLNHKYFGPSLRDWEINGAMRPSAKKKAILAIACSWLLMVFLGIKLWVLALQFLILTGVSIFIWTRPNA